MREKKIAFVYYWLWRSANFEEDFKESFPLAFEYFEKNFTESLTDEKVNSIYLFSIWWVTANK